MLLLEWRCVAVGVAGMALVEVDAGLRAKGRKMRRNASNPNAIVEIQQVYCIRGGARRDWLVLPLMSLNGRLCAPVSPCTTWLHQVLNGGCGRNTENPHHGAITNLFVQGVLAVLQRLRAPGRLSAKARL